MTGKNYMSGINDF